MNFFLLQRAQNVMSMVGRKTPSFQVLKKSVIVGASGVGIGVVASQIMDNSNSEPNILVV